MNNPHIFVSHSHRDDEFGMRLISELRTRLGEEAVWYDSSGGLHGGDEWWNRIVAEITSRDVFIVIFSPDSVNSKWVIDETNIAWALRHRIGTRIIPVLYRPCDLRADWLLLQSVSFVAPRSFDSALSDLLQVLNVPMDQVTQPIPVAPVNTSPLAPLIARLTQEIHAAFGQEDWTAVISRANLLLSEAGEMPPALWRELGLAYVAIGDGAAALPALDEALKADQFDASTLRGKGLALALLGNPADAIPLLDRAYTLAPFTDVSQRLALLNDLYGVLESAQRWEDALRRIQEALRLAPGDSTWTDRQLDMFGRCGRDDDALQLANDLVSSYPTIVRRWVNKRLDRDRVNVNLGDALRVIDLGLQAFSNDDALLTAKLDILTQTGKEDEAFTNAASYVPLNGVLVDKWLHSRFWAHMQAQAWQRALLVADTALRAGLNDVTWPIGKVEALRSMGRAQDAYALASQTTSQPRYSREGQAWLALASSAAALDNEAEVRRAIAAATQLNGEDNPAVAAARKQFLEPYEMAAKYKVQSAARAEEARQKKQRQRRMSLIGLAVSVVVLACLAVSLVTLNGYRTLQAQAAQTVTAKTAVVQTHAAATAAGIASEISCVRNADKSGACGQFYGTTYLASAPGSCDNGGGTWTASTDPIPTVTCTGKGAKVSIPNSTSLGSLYFQPSSGEFSNNYVVIVTISNLTGGSDCGILFTNEQNGRGAYGFWICGNGSWYIERYDNTSGNPTEIGSGSMTSASTYQLSAAVVADARIISIGEAGEANPVSEVYHDSTYTYTEYVGLSVNSQGAASAQMSNFSYTPLA
ncbi:MAG TPA: toll/interleukin-1 receptor domain-containing protein [Ktedonobacterales bacterium]|jgi:tetratricopeptide (TPR) repeat protein